MNFIQKNKNFLLTICAGAIVFFLSHYLIQTGLYAHIEQLQQELQTSQEVLNKKREKLLAGSKNLQYQRSLNPILEKKLLPSILTQLTYLPSEPFLWKSLQQKSIEGQSPDFVFKKLLRSLSRELATLAKSKNLIYPGHPQDLNLGFEKKNIQKENIEIYLKRLELAYKITKSILHHQLTPLQIQPEEPPTHQNIPQTPYSIQRLPLTFQLQGPLKSIHQFLLLLAQNQQTLPTPNQKPNSSRPIPPLELRELELKKDPNSSQLRLKIKIAAIKLEKQQPQNQTTPSHTFSPFPKGRFLYRQWKRQ